MAEKKTNAMRQLDKAKIAYTVHTYEAEDGAIDGVSVALKCNEDPSCVYKTLATQGADHNYYVFVIPVAEELDLKKCAVCAGVKSVEMIHVKDLLKITGYIRGGCSPVGMKKQFRTFIDEKVLQCASVLVSGGRIGTQVDMKPEDLLKAASAETADLCRLIR